MAVMDRPGGAPAEEAPVPKGAGRVRTTLLRYFSSNATRSELPQDTVARLEGVRQKGNDMLSLIEPYRSASVFDLGFAQQFVSDAERGKFAGAASLSAKAADAIRDSLELAANEFMSERFAVFPVNDRDMETTCVISAYAFLGAAARYCPDAIFESADEPGAKEMLARSFLDFYDRNLSRFMTLDTKWDSAQHFHETCFESYTEFKRQMPELFDMLRRRISTSQGELMAPFGSDDYSISWLSLHYGGAL